MPSSSRRRGRNGSTLETAVLMSAVARKPARKRTSRNVRVVPFAASCAAINYTQGTDALLDHLAGKKQQAGGRRVGYPSFSDRNPSMYCTITAATVLMKSLVPPLTPSISVSCKERISALLVVVPLMAFSSIDMAVCLLFPTGCDHRSALSVQGQSHCRRPLRCSSGNKMELR
jgi:hypothetical protein